MAASSQAPRLDPFHHRRLLCYTAASTDIRSPPARRFAGLSYDDTRVSRARQIANHLSPILNTYIYLGMICDPLTE